MTDAERLAEIERKARATSEYSRGEDCSDTVGIVMLPEPEFSWLLEQLRERTAEVERLTGTITELKLLMKAVAEHNAACEATCEARGVLCAGLRGRGLRCTDCPAAEWKIDFALTPEPSP